MMNQRKLIKVFLTSLFVLLYIIRCGGTREIVSDAYLDVSHDTPDTGRDGPIDYDDSDGDCISDTDEGRYSSGGPVDTDGDTTPDYQDDDSDNDTIKDSDEVGRQCDRIDLYPKDSDGDTIPNFRSVDSDSNGINDDDEGTIDTDNDGVPDFADTDNDGDNIPDTVEIPGDGTGSPSSPCDYDGDTLPDYLDTDSDNDSICDLWEGTVDTDGDGTPDRYDDDTDGDGLPDQMEGEVEAECSAPVDSDGDGNPNYRDPDSDDDGLPDGYEWETSRTDYRNQDSDDDGVTDLIEVAAGTDPTNPNDNPRIRGDFVFKVPYQEAPDPPMDTLVFSTDIQQADVYFLVDTTASMGGEIENLTNTLSDVIIPSVRDEIPDVWFGVGAFDDYPISPYGSNIRGDKPFYQLQRMTVSAEDAQSAVSSLTVHFGDDRPESQVTALYTIATGTGDGTYIDPPTDCRTTEKGYPCFREKALPIIILITDAPFHNGPGGDYPYEEVPTSPVDYSTMITQLIALQAKVIGVNSGWARAHLVTLASDTSTVDISGNPLVFDIFSDGTGLGEQIVTAISILAKQVPIEVSTQPEDDPSDSVDATLFINRIVPNTEGGIPAPDNPAIICIGGLETADIDDDPYDDVFTSVLPGTAVCFDIYINENDFVPATEEVQTYKAIIKVIGDRVTVLDQRDVYFFIPPKIPEIFG